MLLSNVLEQNPIIWKEKKNALFNIYNPFWTVNSICSLKWWLIQSSNLNPFLRSLVLKPKGTGEIESCHQCNKPESNTHRRAESNSYTRALMLFVCVPHSKAIFFFHKLKKYILASPHYSTIKFPNSVDCEQPIDTTHKRHREWHHCIGSLGFIELFAPCCFFVHSIKIVVQLRLALRRHCIIF